MLQKDWLSLHKMPPLYLSPGERPFSALKRAPAYDYGLVAGYYGDEEDFVFVIKCSDHLNVDWLAQDFYVAGDFNDWGKAIGQPAWKMQPQRVGDELCFALRVSKDLCVEDKPLRFKFVSSKGQWLSVPPDAPNAVQDSANNYNYELHPSRTGAHRLYFEVSHKTETLGLDAVVWPRSQGLETCTIRCSKLFLSLQTDKALGAIPQGSKTIFRLFAPRASRVQLCYFHPSKPEDLKTLSLALREDSYWEGECAQNLHGFHYYYHVDGEHKDALSHFEPGFKVLDPYALLTVGREGPGIIVDKTQLKPSPATNFQPPAWEDLIVLEGHVRDLIAKAPITLTPEKRLGFKGLERFLKSESNYIKSLGINALELQPIQAFDNSTQDEYHWGYMPINYFAPAPAYVQANASPDQIYELQSLVQTCHEQGLAVIVDVVYNHYGEPNHLLYLDKYHYFEVNEEGHFSNFSGCGNDLRASAPMTQRLIIDSLLHWVEFYKVDGFRFDLAELLGTRVLQAIESALKAVHPNIILIAEPWSFKGHIGYELRSTGFASWNDGYRNFIRKYLTTGDAQGFEYYLQGSLGHLARFPAQSVNYAGSHDDHAWIDSITENPKHNGHMPTLNDRKRTHLMLALLMASIGIPLLAQGMDSLHSKLGVANTYKRGDLNALDYQRAAQYPGTHAYFQAWIRFRLSTLGRLFRLKHRPSEGYFQFFKSPHSSARAVLYNADSTLGHERLLFAINPHVGDSLLNMNGLQANDFKQIADHERLDPEGLQGATFSWEDASGLHLPGLSCGLWTLR